MSGLTQADVTPVRPEEEEKEQEKQGGMQWMRFLTKPGNELKFWGGQAVQTIRRRNQNVQSRGRVGLLKLYSYKEPDAYLQKGGVDNGGTDGILRPGPLPAQRDIGRGIAEAVVDVPLQATSAVQQFYEDETATLQRREAVQTDVGDTPVGRFLLDAKEEIGERFGVQRYELPTQDRWIGDLSSNLTSATIAALGANALGLTPGQNSTLFTGMRANPFSASGELLKTSGPWGAYWRRGFNQKWGSGLARWFTFGLTESALTTSIANQTEAGFADPGDSLATAAFKSYPGNAIEDLTLGGTLSLTGLGLGRLARTIRNGPSSTARARQAKATKDSVNRARDFTEEQGVQTKNADGSYEFVDPASDPFETGPRPPEAAAGDIDRAIEITNQPRSQADAAAQLSGESRPRGMEEFPDAWDPALPEVDTIKRSLDELDDAARARIAETEGPVVDAIAKELEAQRTAPATTEALGPAMRLTRDQQLTARAVFMAMDTAQLRQIANLNDFVNAELARINRTPNNASKDEIVQAILKVQGRGNSTPGPATVPEGAMSVEQRDAMDASILKRAVNQGEVRPSATEAPATPEPSPKDPSDMTQKEVIDEEVRLQHEYKVKDNRAAERAKNQARRDEGYAEMSEPEKQAAGKYDGWDQPEPEVENPVVKVAKERKAAADDAELVKRDELERAGVKIADAKLQLNAEVLMSMLPELTDLRQAMEIIRNKGNKVLYTERVPRLKEISSQFDNDRLIGRTTPITEEYQQAYRDFYGLKKPEPVAPKQTLRQEVEAEIAAKKPTGFVIPDTLSKSAPRFGMAQLKFENPLDMAAYIAQSKTKTKPAWLRAIKAQGYDVDEVVARGREIKDFIQDIIEDETGSRAAPQQPLTLEIPDIDSIRDVVESSGPQLPDFGDVDDEVVKAFLGRLADSRMKQLTADFYDIAKQIFGEDVPRIKLNQDKVVGTRRAEWGGDGKKQSETLGTYYPVRDLVVINNVLERTSGNLNSTMFHESWHRIQNGYLNRQQLRVLDGVFGKQNLEFFSRIEMGRGVQPIEIQARAFENFATMKRAGRTRKDVMRAEMIEFLDREFPQAKSWRKKLTAEAYAVLEDAWMRLLNFRERTMNYISGNGFMSVYDLFDQAYSGQLVANQRFEGFYQVLKELEAMTEYDIKSGGEALERKVVGALERQEYWNKWKGQANQVAQRADAQIAALKQQALDGGC